MVDTSILGEHEESRKNSFYIFFKLLFKFSLEIFHLVSPLFQSFLPKSLKKDTKNTLTLKFRVE
jgi:hypothetical protein